MENYTVEELETARDLLDRIGSDDDAQNVAKVGESRGTRFRYHARLLDKIALEVQRVNVAKATEEAAAAKRLDEVIARAYEDHNDESRLGSDWDHQTSMIRDRYRAVAKAVIEEYTK